MSAVQGVDLRAWPARRPEDPAVARRVRLRTVIGASVFLVFFLRTVAEEWNRTPAGGHAALVVLGAVYLVSYLLTLYFGQLFGPLPRVLAIAWLFLTGSAVAFVTGDPGNLTMLSYAVAAAILMLPLRWGVLIGLLTTAAVMAGTRALHGAVDWGDTTALIMLTVGMVTLTQLIRTINQLRAAQARIAALAVAEERSRVARDLHDVLGHSLTTITVKTGLARRILESGAEPARALAELHDAERLSRQALTEIRATVSGYRRPSLGAELAGAHEALRAAGIDAVLPQAVDDVADELQEPFAYVIREGVTNVIRHSGAGRCEIRLGARRVEIRDDGRAAGPCTSGNGLAGLAERMAAVGGRLVAEPLPGKGFRLCAEA